MKLIIGLGNPGKEYEDTRHNIGFKIIDKIQNDWNFPSFKFNKKFNACVSKKFLRISHSKFEILLIKALTFMNHSGIAVKSILNFYKLKPKHIIVVHDDLDIMLGKYKIAFNSSSAGHNGVQSIIENIHTQKFKRIRVGINIRKKTEEINACKIDARSFVLEKFNNQETKKISAIEDAIIKDIKKLLIIKGI